MILRGADELILTGGRSMLAKILKGSKDNLTCLEAWKLMEVKKVVARIAVVENAKK